MVDNLLLDHVGIPHVLDLAVQLEFVCSYDPIGRLCHLLVSKVMGWGWVGGPLDFNVSSSPPGFGYFALGFGD